ncbi:nucleoporin Nup186/Nup192/Nup205 [Hygrophoropsis aurantiaca]|uniref:Nucleoporin Nup186/Nup192/Nup205 n=1 Tax=Hygrophoropsis aurantiaca TaxID=72124 RepID=A0ACB8A7D4_9AGAM|nr:nucleoporin Nup186/Nup192/Nup205 [Hygrophoropsis aurantiaca]
MESISQLRNILSSTLSSRGHGEQDLFDELMAHQPQLVALYDVGASSQQEQRELQSGKTIINGRSLAVNADFAQQAIFLGQQLGCSEKYVAGILHTVMTENPNINPVSCIESAIVEYHQRRRHLIDCLRFILEAAELAEVPDAPRMYSRLNAFVASELISESSTKGISLAHAILKQVESLGPVVAAAQAAKQGAPSNTTAPSNQGGTPSLGYDILNARYDSLKYERRNLAFVYYQIARLGYIAVPDVQKALDWLSANPNDPMAFYILTSIFTVFDSVDPNSNGGKTRRALATDQAMLGYMKKKLASATEWKDTGLKAAILLKWTLFLAETRHRDSSLGDREGFRTEELETQIWNAVQGDAFTYLSVVLIQLRKRTHSSLPTSFANSLQLTPEQEQSREPPSEDFKLAVLNACENLVRMLISYASSELRKIKQRQEDIVLASARTDRSRMFRSSMPNGPESEAQPVPRNDIAMLYSFLGLLYSSLPPERAIQFWSGSPHLEGRRITYLEISESAAGKLPMFLQWAVWSTQVRDVTMTMALYDMLSGLAKGQHCSELAYNFLARGGGEVVPGNGNPSAAGASHYGAGPTVSWSMIFALLDSWATPSNNLRPQPPVGASFGGFNTQSMANHPPSQTQHHVSISPKDVLLAQSFLRLLSTVVSGSVGVRLAVSGSSHFRAIPTLVSLVPLGIPLELKGSIFDTLAAFCEPGAGLAGVEICKTVWTLMERLEIINVRAGSNRIGAGTLSPVKGVEVELEEVETVYKLYPATISFLRLLSTLIHTSKRIPLKDRVTDSEPLNTIPDSLGQPYRLPGIGPYILFVVDNVFANIPRREYARQSDRWQMNDLCMSFIERVLASYELESLVTPGDDSQLKRETVVPLLVHPGYDIMKRLLSNSPLQANILSYIVEGVEGFEKDLADEEPHFRSTIIRVLRIVHRVLEIQDIFLDVLIPLLAEFDSTQFVGIAHSRSYYTRFDQALSYGSHHIPAIAAYVVYPVHPELVLLAVKIITQLSSSNSVNNLMSLIERSNDSDRILTGFRQLLDVDNLDDVDVAETHAEQSTGAGAPDREVEGPQGQAIRLAVLDLLIQNTESTRSFPNIGHFLLFGGPETQHQIQDPHAIGAYKTCVHVILDLLSTGVPRMRGKGKDRDRNVASKADALFSTLPSLAERFYHVIHNLCMHPRTSDVTMRYLRTREDFFARHLASIPSKLPETAEDPYIEVLYQDGSRVTTSSSALRAFIGLRSRILDLAALDLHVLTNKGHHKGVIAMLDILFGTEVYGDETSEWEDEMQFQEIGQSHMRIIEFIQSLSFDWSDSLTVNPVDLQFLGELNLHSCVRLDAAGCEVVDRTALLSLLTVARRTLHAQGRITSPAHVERLNAETTYILESCAIENHRREVSFAVATGYETWRRLLDITLMKCFSRLPHDRRENMLFDLLHVLPVIVRSPDIQEPTAVLLSEAVLSCITKLREDRRHQVMLQSAGGDAEAGSLPAERLYALLRNILECILDNNRSELVRGNLYATLVSYLHLVETDDSSAEASVDNFGRRSMSMSRSAFGSREDLSVDDSQMSLRSPSPAIRSQASASVLESGTVSVMKSVLERLVATVARDAIDGTEVWKTVAFMLLDSLVQLSRSDKSRILLTVLVRHGLLLNFVRGLKESETQLQFVLKPDPNDLNPLYVYEAKMSLLIRMAQTRSGAERLLEAQILPILAQCEYLDTRPEADQSFMDQDSFLPSAIQRYHQLFMPALQLAVAMLATLGSNHATASHQTLDFLSSHRDTIIIMLKNENEEVPLSFIQEVHLLVSLSASVLSLVPKSEMLSVNSGFGGIHGAILSLAARCLGNDQWRQSVKPQSDAEMLQASVLAPGHSSESKFDANVRQQERLLRKAVVEYLGAASEFTEPEITLVLSPIIAIPKHDDRSSRFVATIPTVGDAIEALYDLCDDLAHILKQVSDLAAGLSSRDHIRVDNIHEVVRVSDPSFLQDLNIEQKRSLIHREYGQLKNDVVDDLKTILSTTEMLLLLLWRHLVNYAEQIQPTNSSSNLRISTATRLLAATDSDTFRADAGQRLIGVLTRISSLDLTIDTVGEEWQSYKGYIDIMSRRLRDTVGLHDELEA